MTDEYSDYEVARIIQDATDSGYNAGYRKAIEKAVEWVRDYAEAFMVPDPDFEDCPIEVKLSGHWEEDLRLYMSGI